MLALMVCGALSSIYAILAPARAWGGQPERLLAHRILHPSKGGTVAARNGARIYVPAHVLSGPSLVTITRLRHRRYDFHINGPWRGSVLVTLPRARRATFVMHKLGQVWVREGNLGHRSVWVEHLSPFSWLVDQIKAKACLTRNPAAFLNCLKKKGISKLTGPIVGWFLDIIPNDFSQACKDKLKSSTAVDILYNALFSEECIAHAGDPGPPPAPPPSTPPPSSPPPAPQPTPTPSPSAPPPPPAQPPPPAPAKIDISRGGPAPSGYWYSMVLSGFSPGSSVTVTCRDSADPQGFWTQTFTINGAGQASDSTLCYSADGPDHWVTGGGVESNHVTW